MDDPEVVAFEEREEDRLSALGCFRAALVAGLVLLGGIVLMVAWRYGR